LYKGQRVKDKGLKKDLPPSKIELNKNVTDRVEDKLQKYQTIAFPFL
jgi:hypothetical protein